MSGRIKEWSPTEEGKKREEDEARQLWMGGGWGLGGAGGLFAENLNEKTLG